MSGVLICISRRRVTIMSVRDGGFAGFAAGAGIAILSSWVTTRRLYHKKKGGANEVVE